MKKQVFPVLLIVLCISLTCQIQGQGQAIGGIGGIQRPGYLYFPVPGGAYNQFGQPLNVWNQPGYVGQQSTVPCVADEEERHLSPEEKSLRIRQAYAQVELFLISETRKIRQQVGLSKEEQQQQINQLVNDVHRRFGVWRDSLLH